MKKKVFILMVAGSCILSFPQLKAQNLFSSLMERIDLGIKAEANYSNFILKDMPGAKSDFGLGGTFGQIIRFNISNYFAIQEDILFTYATSDFTQDGTKDTYQYIGAEVPIYLMGQWKTLSGGRIYGGIGPYFGLGFKAKFKDSDLDLYKKYDGNKPYMNRLSNGLAAQIGYEFKDGLQINASYRVGTNALDAAKDDHKMLPQSASLGIAYSF